MLRSFFFICASLLCATLALPPAAAQTEGAAQPALAIELNKLEAVGDTCRAFFIVRNGVGANLTNLDLDTFIFGSDGIIAQRLALPFGAIPAGRMRILSFDFSLGCEAIGSLFVNEVLDCTFDGAAVDCPAALVTSSRSPQTLDY
ncbi:MAG: hypothetical protein AAGF45_01555 [Pseudomonadota bacterium]